MHDMAAGDAHVLHLLVLVVPVPAALAWWALDRAWRAGAARSRLAVVSGVVALTYLAGLVHVVALPEHARESALFGAFFALAATAQLVYAVVLSRHPVRPVLEAGALAQVGLVLVWAATRTVGLPVGPAPWRAEPVGFLDLTCVLSEVSAVALSLWLLAPRRPAGGGRRLRQASQAG